MSGPETYDAKSAYRGPIAQNYDKDRQIEAIWGVEQAWVETWASGLQPGSLTLDLPAGTGRFVGLFRNRGVRVHAADISEDMLAELKRLWPEGPPGLLVERADAEKLAYPEGHFDQVICWRLLHLLPPGVDERVLRELGRVCKGEIVVEVFGVEPGGVFVARARVLWRRLRRRFSRRASGCAWGHIRDFQRSTGEMARLIERAGLVLVREEVLGAYGPGTARVYVLRAKNR